ncbi:MAG TPA: nucleoside hydrolase [Ktedonobacteraceae bacterium]|jgi:purine nucleosidase|nr:nucleoside hydrolase [Ktedonobacteraceae bacterium]
MHRIILDTDPGIDDALAIFLALASPDIQLEAITTVSGNVHVDYTTRNALALLELAGRGNIPVARGCDRPLVRHAVEAGYVHGQNGLGNVQLPEPHLHPVPQHATDLLIEKILAAPGEITLVAIGPLTNIAMAVRQEPRIAQNTRELFIMGGALRVPGNVTPTAEFNIFADPEAASIVLHAGWPIRLVSLDATMQTNLYREQVDRLAANGHPVTTLIQQAVSFFIEEFGRPRGIHAFHMHDPLCLASVIHPEFVTWRPAYVDVELTGTLTTGTTVAFFEQLEDLDPALERQHQPNVQASMGANNQRFIDFYLEQIQAAYA